MQNPLKDAESLRYNKNNYITDIGKKVKNLKKSTRSIHWFNKDIKNNIKEYFESMDGYK